MQMPQYFSSTWRTLTHPSKPIMPLIHSPQDSNMGLWVLGPNDRYQAVLILMLSDFSHWSQTSPTFLLLRECGHFPLNLCHFIRHSSPTWPVHVLAGPQSLSLLRQVSEFNSGPGNQQPIGQQTFATFSNISSSRNKEDTLFSISLTLRYVFPSTGS